MASVLSGFESLDGDSWQKLCMQVLHIEHGPGNLIEIPDEDRGDAGIEAFSLDGCAYACYAPEGEPLATAVRREKQIGKLNGDTRKFISNGDKLSSLFPPDHKVNRWILLVPHINSRDVIAQASKRTGLIREAGLSYAAPGIVATVLTLDSYAVAKRTAVSTQLAKLHLPPQQEVSFGSIDAPDIETMHGKLAKTNVFAESSRRDRLLIDCSGITWRGNVIASSSATTTRSFPRALNRE